MKRELGEDALREKPEIMLAVAEARIAWVLDHPHMSEWLRLALRSSDGLDPIALQNDVQMLWHLISPRSQAQVEIAKISAPVD